MASTARPRILTIRSKKPKAKSSPEQSLREIAAIIEQHMTNEGLSEKEKNAKVAHFALLVDNEINEKTTQHAKPLKRRQIAGSRV
jgi:N-acetylglucosamine kinase-like BadF-type ATPase